MKGRYIALGLAQFLLIFMSGFSQRISWDEVDFQSNPASLSLQLSFYSLIGWLATIAAAVSFATTDKINRALILLFLVVLLPSVEFFSWLGLSF